MYFKTLFLLGQFVKKVISQFEWEVDLDRAPSLSFFVLELCIGLEPFLLLCMSNCFPRHNPLFQYIKFNFF
jgi:hypothetical protein